MYIRKSLRTHKDKTDTNYLLVKSAATDKGPRRKAICSLGDLSPRPEAEWLKPGHKHKLESSLVGQRPLVQPDAEVAARAKKVREREGGSIHVGHQFWKRLEMDQILEVVGMEERPAALTCGMVMNRLIQPCSEHAMTGWMGRRALGERVGIAEGQTVAVDRGMGFEENWKQIRARKLHDVAACRQGERDRSWEALDEEEKAFRDMKSPLAERPIFH